MEKNEIEISVLAVLKTVLSVDLTSESKREEVAEWDSLKHIDVIFSLEDEFNIRFDEDILIDIVGVTSLVEIINSILNNR